MARTYGDNVIEAADEWYEVLVELSSKWGTLMDESWADLPPALAAKLLTASSAFADAGDALQEVLRTRNETETAS